MSWARLDDAGHMPFAALLGPAAPATGGVGSPGAAAGREGGRKVSGEIEREGVARSNGGGGGSVEQGTGVTSEGSDDKAVDEEGNEVNLAGEKSVSAAAPVTGAGQRARGGGLEKGAAAAAAGAAAVAAAAAAKGGRDGEREGGPATAAVTAAPEPLYLHDWSLPQNLGSECSLLKDGFQVQLKQGFGTVGNPDLSASNLRAFGACERPNRHVPPY